MENNNSSILWNISNAYRGVMMTEALTPAVIRLVFIKYAADNYLFAESKEEMIRYAELQKNMAGRNVNEFVGSIMPVLELIDSKIDANGILKNSYSAYTNDLLGGLYKKKTFSDETSERILSVLGSIDLSERDDDNGLLFEAVKKYVYESLSRAGRYGGENGTNNSLNILVKKLLNVNKSDTYMDFACGYGLSALEITDGLPKHLYLSDINEECVQMAIMLSVIQGKVATKETFRIENIYDREKCPAQVSKAFVDFPLADRLYKTTYPYNDGTIFAIHRMIEGLKEEGTGIITCHPNLLFRNNKETNEFRKFLLKKGYLEAVISLPPINTGSAINIILLIISKKRNKSTIFVDASSNDVIQFSNNARHFNTELIEDGINSIVDIVEPKKEVLGVSKLVTLEEVEKKNTFVPKSYIVFPRIENNVSSHELNDKLNTLYDQLIKAHKEL